MTGSLSETECLGRQRSLNDEDAVGGETRAQLGVVHLTWLLQLTLVRHALLGGADRYALAVGRDLVWWCGVVWCSAVFYGVVW